MMLFEIDAFLPAPLKAYRNKIVKVMSCVIYEDWSDRQLF